jgi:hypothetical protein
MCIAHFSEGISVLMMAGFLNLKIINLVSFTIISGSIIKLNPAIINELQKIIKVGLNM